MAILQRYTKQPSERKYFDISFSKYLLRHDDAPRAVDPVVASAAAGIVLDEVEWFADAAFVRLWFEGGTHGVAYAARALLHTEKGEILEGDILIKVKGYGHEAGA